MSTVERTSTNEILVYLSPSQAVPSKVPFELTEYIHPGDWATRLPTILRTASRYSSINIERVWVILLIAACIALPLGLHSIVWKITAVKDNFTTASIIEARAIGFAIFVGVVILFLTPMLVWKMIGRRHLNKLATNWAKSDRLMKGQNAIIPTWTISSPKVLTVGITVTISIPAGSRPSTFHRDAYLPNYINKPDDDDTYYYPYKGQQGGLPRMSTVGNIPLYMDAEKREMVANRV